MSDERVTIQGGQVEARLSEGVTATMDLPDLVQLLAPPAMSTAGVVLPEGVRMMFSTRRMSIFIWELVPQVYRVKWIGKDSKVPFGMPGHEARYEFRRLALPYLIIVAVFARDPRGRLVLTGRNEAYFRTAPLADGTDRLLFPALLNISKFPRGCAAEHSLAWICTQHTNLAGLAGTADDNRRLRESLQALKHTLMDTGFNYSSEHHELTSYWSLSARRIPQVADLDRWEALSREDPLFTLTVPWLPARIGRKPLTVNLLAERIMAQGGPDTPIATSADLARLVFNGRARRRPKH
jgi:hypothetical protein